MNDNDTKSPRIISVAWGKMEVKGFGLGKDRKLWPGGCCSWDWQKTGTSHFKGVQIDDIDDLINRGCEVIVIGKGFLSRLKITKVTTRYLEQKKIKIITAHTRKAVRIYNSHVDRNIRIGGLFHTTC